MANLGSHKHRYKRTMLFRHIWLIIIGRTPYCYSTERMEFEMALENFTAAVVTLEAAADRLIAKAAADASAHTQAAADLAAVDTTATAAIQPVIDKLTTAAPAA
jgi:hypothetical protein